LVAPNIYLNKQEGRGDKLLRQHKVLRSNSLVQQNK
jgi:hypothetical protein